MSSSKKKKFVSFQLRNVILGFLLPWASSSIPPPSLVGVGGARSPAANMHPGVFGSGAVLGWLEGSVPPVVWLMLEVCAGQILQFAMVLGGFSACFSGLSGR